MISFEFRGIEAWISGASRFASEYPKVAQPMFDDVTDRFFELTQKRVHVITGELKASGRQVRAEGLSRGQLVGGVIYTSEHGFWEMQRGGEHDFITEPLTEVEDDYGEALQEAFRVQLGGW